MHYGFWVAGKLAIPNDARGLYRVHNYRGPDMIIPDVIMGEQYEKQVFI